MPARPGPTPGGRSPGPTIRNPRSPRPRVRPIPSRPLRLPERTAPREPVVPELPPAGVAAGEAAGGGGVAPAAPAPPTTAGRQKTGTETPTADPGTALRMTPVTRPPPFPLPPDHVPVLDRAAAREPPRRGGPRRNPPATAGTRTSHPGTAPPATGREVGRIPTDRRRVTPRWRPGRLRTAPASKGRRPPRSGAAGGGAAVGAALDPARRRHRRPRETPTVPRIRSR
jgi:hypothetical protein